MVPPTFSSLTMFQTLMHGLIQFLGSRAPALCEARPLLQRVVSCAFAVASFSTENKWPQFLSIQAGQIRLCNTRVNKTTTAEECSRRNPEPPPPPRHHHMGLDLDLNLTCESLRKRDGDHHSHHVNVKQVPGSPDRDDLRGEHERKKGSDDDHQGGLIRTPSWLSSEGDHKEMVATVCMRCHMLVMLCKSSPSCPNCKFMHPPDQNPSKFLKRRCSLFY